MRFTFEEQSTANEDLRSSFFSFAHEPKIPWDIVTHQGRLYKKVGMSERDLSQSERFVCLLKLIGTFVLGLLGCCLPFLTYNFSESFSTLRKEVSSGKMRIIHCIPKTTAEQEEALENEVVEEFLADWAREHKSE
ncbi:MAG: hypothetical protein H0W88_10235 [Parachlamydiaceae bacterium]|nr:hypothetical protein [Parachlamydiaceae bacterium]